MTAKNKAKSNQLANADLNFISNKPLEYIAEEMQNIKAKAVDVQIVHSNDDIALFQMTFQRENRTTAEVVGRLQRWAGNMTHVYCDGRVFRKKMTYVSTLARWALMLALAAPFVLCPLSFFTSGAAHEFLTVLTSLSILVFVLVGTLLGTYMLFKRILLAMNVHQTNARAASNPEGKDRERLLHYLTDIIRDDFSAGNQADYDMQDAEPLSDEEINAILRQAEAMARWKK